MASPPDFLAAFTSLGLSISIQSPWVEISLIFIPLLDGRLYKKFIISENNSELDDIEIIWKDFDRDEWNDYADKLESMNLTQSWDYGEFKNKYENYLIKRGIIKHRDKFIGLVQKFQKKFLFFKIDIINRGPILINTKYANLIKNKILREKKSFFFNFLVFIPELKFHYKNIIVNKLAQATLWLNCWNDAIFLVLSG